MPRIKPTSFFRVVPPLAFLILFSCWLLLDQDVETVSALPVEEAVRLGRIKASPYTLNGRSYHAIPVEQARNYKEIGIASWYGYETWKGKEGYITASGELFDPLGLTAAHKHLPLPTDVKVTNLENGRSIIVRVNDRGPFPSALNPKSGERIIDLSMAAAKKLGFYKKGLAKVSVETIPSK